MNARPRVAIVTGAGSGIGREVSAVLLETGWRVALGGRRQDALRDTAEAARALPTDVRDTAEAARALPTDVHAAADAVLVVPTDVRDPASVRALFACVLERWGRVDLLFNNAGVFGPSAPLEDVALADWRTVLDTNLTGAFKCAQEAVRTMKAQDPRGGRIINNGSISAHVPRPNAVAYTATKHAITGLTRAIALEGRAHDIACGQIDIGNASTAITAAMERGVLQADGAIRAEPTMDARHAAEAVRYMAGLPLEANVQFLTVLATKMPYAGRG